MNIDFSDKELIFLYGRVKKEYLAMKNQKTVRYSKSDLKFYEDLIFKMEEAHPGLVRLTF